MRRRSSLRSIEWVRVVEPERTFGSRIRGFLFDTVPKTFGFELKSVREKRVSPLRNAALQNAPVVAAASAEDEARQLLHAAAEIEHALLIEYLYAAFSLQSNPRKTLIRIAVQEMSHLLAVQNLLLFLGAGPYFERQDISPDPDIDPFPFGLRSFRQKETVERFVLAEMPVLETLGVGDQKIIDEIRGRIDPQSTFNRVGVLYGRIYWLFQTDAAPEGPWTDVSNMADIGPLPQWHIGSFQGEATFASTQASTDEKGVRANGNDKQIWWQDQSAGGAFATIDSRSAALKLIYDIAVQGEGLAAGGASSHFGIFFNALKSHDELEPDDFFAVPENPSTVAGAELTDISDPVALALCALLNDRYQIMLVALTAAFHLKRTDEAENRRRQELVFWAFYEMKSAITNLVREIVVRPCKAGGSPNDLCAGPTFELGGIDLTGNINALEQECRALHIHARQSIEVLKGLGFGVGEDVVSKIEATDRGRYPDI
ncbi:ferritin-like domain-containing protein [Bradyrhizobium sp. JYMT SZCCT0428]|uniref:ferritin-like domain-containing protein n=1 Tax=Bradyrhizobium sp. JYMT SZCCT0428 TaxID=2807673 RepID=UPI001BA912B8|nr:ferritin-like domain-containing protein [Bradyrhizobium sp. JYMT SZCCT0428]MBR1154274.1 hypothetical protein [Bradyrhizobium sp. JYMT SZCCT0428]